MAKFSYRMIVNGNNNSNRKSNDECYSFGFSQTKNIKLIVTEKGASITAEIGNDYRDDPYSAAYLHNLMKEGIKRVSLLHLLKYQKPIAIKKLTLEISADGDEDGKDVRTYDMTKNIVPFSMVPKLLRPISKAWDDQEVLQNVLEFRKSKTDLSAHMAALYAYLFSKTKSYETERFTYLWIAMDGIFNVLLPDTKNLYDKRSRFLSEFGLGSEALPDAPSDEICPKISLKIKDMDVITKESLIGGAHKELADYINQNMPVNKYSKKPFDQSAYGFFLTDYPYYLRNKYFHGNRPLELFSFLDDLELRSIYKANRILEEFLDEHLISIFTSKK